MCSVLDYLTRWKFFFSETKFPSEGGMSSNMISESWQRKYLSIM